MAPSFELISQDFNTSYAPLCVLGYLLQERGTLVALREFDGLQMKTCQHTPGEKLQDAWLLLLAGYPSLYLFNSTLRADPLLARAWGREQFAEQSNISRTLDAFTPETVCTLRKVSTDFWRVHSQLPQHDWRQRLCLDLDLTPLPASARAEASTKGYLGKKTPPVGKSHA